MKIRFDYTWEYGRYSAIALKKQAREDDEILAFTYDSELNVCDILYIFEMDPILDHGREYDVPMGEIYPVFSKLLDHFEELR